MKSCVGSHSIVSPLFGSTMRVCRNASLCHSGHHWTLPSPSQPSGASHVIAVTFSAIGSVTNHGSNLIALPAGAGGTGPLPWPGSTTCPASGVRNAG